MDNWVDRLIKDYRKSKRLIVQHRDTIDPTAEEYISLLNETIADMSFAIEWIRTGRRPYQRRGVDRRGVYREPFVLDKDLFPSLYEPPAVRPFRLTEEQRTAAIEAIGQLSDRERDCYLLHVSKGMSYAEIGNTLGLSKRTVQEYTVRAKKKILATQTG